MGDILSLICPFMGLRFLSPAWGHNVVRLSLRRSGVKPGDLVAMDSRARRAASVALPLATVTHMMQNAVVLVPKPPLVGSTRSAIDYFTAFMLIISAIASFLADLLPRKPVLRPST